MPEEKPEEKIEEKKHCCSVCGKASETVICQRCEEKIRGEAFEKKRDVEKAGSTGSGRK